MCSGECVVLFLDSREDRIQQNHSVANETPRTEVEGDICASLTAAKECRPQTVNPYAYITYHYFNKACQCRKQQVSTSNLLWHTKSFPHLNFKLLIVHTFFSVLSAVSPDHCKNMLCWLFLMQHMCWSEAAHCRCYEIIDMDQVNLLENSVLYFLV